MTWSLPQIDILKLLKQSREPLHVTLQQINLAFT